ncbi:MAG: RNA polymerase sigma-70 factor (ECF subfamily) [Planctomycetota bacterium]|jgi:RNA polymerase sigma-70 factor (ECF subfamily)
MAHLPKSCERRPTNSRSPNVKSRSPNSKTAAKHAAAANGDVDLLALYRDGEPQAFRQLVDLYRDRMLQFFYRLCWDRQRSEDLTQDLFLKLMLGSKRYRPEGRMATFVYRVATNLWIDHYRQQRPRPRFYSFDQVVHANDDSAPRQYAGDDPSPHDQLSDGEDRAAMRQGLERLTEPHRLVFELAVYQERPYGEISELLGIPVGTVKSRMHNAVHALKEMLGSAEQQREQEHRQKRVGGAG